MAAAIVEVDASISPRGKLVPVLGWEPEWSVLSGLPFFSVRHGLRIVALHGSADPTIGGAVSFPFAAKLAAINLFLNPLIDFRRCNGVGMGWRGLNVPAVTFIPSASIALANCLASFPVGNDFVCLTKGARFAISSDGTAVLA